MNNQTLMKIGMLALYGYAFFRVSGFILLLMTAIITYALLSDVHEYVAFNMLFLLYVGDYVLRVLFIDNAIFKLFMLLSPYALLISILALIALSAYFTKGLGLLMLIAYPYVSVFAFIVAIMLGLIYREYASKHVAV